jgi:hypothetical protein
MRIMFTCPAFRSDRISLKMTYLSRDEGKSKLQNSATYELFRLLGYYKA